MRPRLSMGAEAVAKAIASEAAKTKQKIEIVRTGSRGMLWLEPLVEVETEKGRVAYGPVSVGDVAGLFKAKFLDRRHSQTRSRPHRRDSVFQKPGAADFRPLRHHRSGVDRGLSRERRLRGPHQGADDGTGRHSGRGHDLRPARSRWRRLPHRHQVEDGPRYKADQKYICCNADEGDSGTFADRMLMEGDPFCLIEGMTIAGIAVGATRGYIYIRSEYPHAVATMREAIRVADEANWLGRTIQGSPYDFELVRTCRRRRLHLRRGDLDARQPRGQARARPLQAAAAGNRGACSASRPSSITC